MEPKPNPRLVLRAMRKKKNVELAIQKNQNLLRGGAGRDATGIPSPEELTMGEERSG
ncbi:hypothetical protein D3C85_717720 [compost metagenome]